MEQKFYTRKELAKALGISTQAVWNRTKRNPADPLFIKCEKILGKTYGITEEEFNRVVNLKYGD